MGPWTSFFADAANFFPFVSFLAGLGGSLHCIGMCGGLVTASCGNGKDVLRYQAGRLIGYFILGTLGGAAGMVFHLNQLPSVVSLLPSLILGSLFIFWGLQQFRGKRSELPAPKFLGRFYTVLWRRLIQNNHGFSRSFFTGALSLFLPCGLLYGVVLGTAALSSYALIYGSLLCFWLGTLPSMVLAPEIVRRLIKPLRSKLPRVYALSLVLIGVITLGVRVGKLPEASSSSDGPKKMRCH